MSCDLKNVNYNYFAPHEGKSLSDTFGGLAKQAYVRTTTRMAGVDDGVGCPDDDADQASWVAEQVRERMLAGLERDENGKVGGLSFFM